MEPINIKIDLKIIFDDLSNDVKDITINEFDLIYLIENKYGKKIKEIYV